jgi:formylmethanofuran dehydrogenase subunit C
VALRIEASGEKCLGDFTFDFYWQHQGSRLNPDEAVGGISRRQMVEALRKGQEVQIKGEAGSRLGSSLGVDLIKLGGTGRALENSGSIVVDGDVGSHMGISMLRGAIYVSGRIAKPLGNALEVQSDRTGYRKYVSITEVLEKGLPVIEPNRSDQKGLIISDGLVRDTLGARNPSDKTLTVDGDTGMSTGILMSSGLILVEGGAGKNTGVFMRGGRLIIKGNTEDFTGAEMRGGEILVEGNMGSFACAKMKGGVVFARSGRPVPPAKAFDLDQEELKDVARALELSPMYAMMYKRFGIQ